MRDDSDAKVRLSLGARVSAMWPSRPFRKLEASLGGCGTHAGADRRLEDSGSVSVQELDRTRTVVEGLQARMAAAREQVRATEARIAVAKQDLENCHGSRALFRDRGFQGRARVERWCRLISAGGGFTRTESRPFVDMDSLEIEVDVNESYIAKVYSGSERGGHPGRLSRVANSRRGPLRSSPRRTDRRQRSRSGSRSIAWMERSFPTWGPRSPS